MAMSREEQDAFDRRMAGIMDPRDPMADTQRGMAGGPIASYGMSDLRRLLGLGAPGSPAPSVDAAEMYQQLRTAPAAMAGPSATPMGAQQMPVAVPVPPPAPPAPRAAAPARPRVATPVSPPMSAADAAALEQMAGGMPIPPGGGQIMPIPPMPPASAVDASQVAATQVPLPRPPVALANPQRPTPQRLAEILRGRQMPSFPAPSSPGWEGQLSGAPMAAEPVMRMRR
jgi:hypothetical protein